jgi:hypothetical protein
MRRAATLVAAGALCLGALYAFQRPFREFPAAEYNTFPLPQDWNEKTEFVFARLMYPWNGWGFHYGDDWTRGNSNWTIDYPRSDRHIVMAMRRLTRMHVRSVEQPVNLDEGDQYDWPWLYGVEVGHWALTDAQVRGLREYLLRGGFLMVDDFHGSDEWRFFEQGIRRVFPDRQIVEIDDGDAIFHTIYDLDGRYQVPGAQFLYSHRLAEKDGTVPHWRGIYDDRGRIMVAICFNMDLGDSWEWADVPAYPARFSDLGIRIAVNYAVYAMTH